MEKEEHVNSPARTRWRQRAAAYLQQQCGFDEFSAAQEACDLEETHYNTSRKLLRALDKANADEKLHCHIPHIEQMLKKENYGTLDEVWVDYFLTEAGQ